MIIQAVQQLLQHPEFDPIMSNTAASATQKVVIILNGPMDWDEWIAIIRTKAKLGDIWKYVDPSTEKAVLPAFKEPVFSMPKNINAEKTTIATLTTVEKEELQALRHEYKRKIKKYEQQQVALANLEVHIQARLTARTRISRPGPVPSRRGTGMGWD